MMYVRSQGGWKTPRIRTSGFSSFMRKYIKLLLALLHPKARLKKQLKYYLAFKRTLGEFSARSDEEHLKKLVQLCKGNNIRVADINKYKERYVDSVHSQYMRTASIKSIRCFLRYCKARGYVCVNPDSIGDDGVCLSLGTKSDIVLDMKDRPGRPPKVELILKAKKLRSGKTPLSYRAIAKKMKKDVSQIYVWCNAPEFRWIKE